MKRDTSERRIIMDHVVYVDAKANELEQLLAGSKRMIVRGAAGRKLPHGRVHAGDTLYLIRPYPDLIFCSSSHRFIKSVLPVVKIKSG